MEQISLKSIDQIYCFVQDLQMTVCVTSVRLCLHYLCVRVCMLAENCISASCVHRNLDPLQFYLRSSSTPNAQLFWNPIEINRTQLHHSFVSGDRYQSNVITALCSSLLNWFVFLFSRLPPHGTTRHLSHKGTCRML